MSESYLGQIVMFGGNYAPRGFAFCNGQLLSIAQNSALFSLLGVAYGGNGVQTFGLPDLRSRLPIHQGQGPGLSSYTIGEMSGTPQVSVLSTQMPNHTHALNATATNASANTVTGNLPAQPTVGSPPYFYVAPVSGKTPPTPVALAAGACGPMGGNIPHDNMMPTQCITFLIATSGPYPTRN